MRPSHPPEVVPFVHSLVDRLDIVLPSIPTSECMARAVRLFEPGVHALDLTPVRTAVPHERQGAPACRNPRAAADRGKPIGVEGPQVARWCGLQEPKN